MPIIYSMTIFTLQTSVLTSLDMLKLPRVANSVDAQKETKVRTQISNRQHNLQIIENLL